MRKYENKRKILCQNKRARHDYFIEDTIECGIVLKGTEIKSLRNGLANINESYGDIKDGEVFLINMHISPYEKGNIFNHDPKRHRKLLLTKREIRKLENAIMQKGYTLVPLKVYLSNQLAKVELAIAKGKKLYDRREDLKKESADREIRKNMKDRNERYY